MVLFTLACTLLRCEAVDSSLARGFFRSQTRAVSVSGQLAVQSAAALEDGIVRSVDAAAGL